MGMALPLLDKVDTLSADFHSIDPRRRRKGVWQSLQRE
jgi:hypothetical protein